MDKMPRNTKGIPYTHTRYPGASNGDLLPNCIHSAFYTRKHTTNHPTFENGWGTSIVGELSVHCPYVLQTI